MSRDQRVKDNWALLHACEQAAKTGAPVAICFNLVRSRLALQCHRSCWLCNQARRMPSCVTRTLHSSISIPRVCLIALTTTNPK